LRLALWYGALTAIVVLVISVATYATHTRGHYDDLDQLLSSTARHLASEGIGSLAPEQLPDVLAVPTVTGVLTRVYDPSGGLLAASVGPPGSPALDPNAVLARHSVPAFDPVAGIAPPFVAVNGAPGTFAVAQGDGGDRWRVYVLPLSPSGRYLEMASSLGPIDTSVGRLRLLLFVLGASGVAAAFLAAWLLAARALRPVRVLTATAREIANSRGFARRVPASSQRDELGELGRTFNDMLESLEAAYRGQERFVADASHELRAPLTAIQANLELMEGHPNMSGTDRAVAVAEASREAVRLSRLVADLLALARADAGVAIRRQPVELDRLSLEAVQESRHLAGGRRVEVEKLAPVVVMGDEDRLKQLLLILLDNASKYTSAAGDIRLRLQQDGSRAELRIRDNGVGIPPGDLPHVFERFYRADPARTRDPGGTGLGLPIARWIVEQHGGEIRLESEPGRGTEVIVRLPVRGAAA
jgi:signal transduction histidine kinase